MLPVEIESRQQAENSDQGTAYSTSARTTQFGPGLRRYDISTDQLEHLRSVFFSWKKGNMRQVSVSTIHRRRRDFRA